jgi:uncharacterized protein
MRWTPGGMSRNVEDRRGQRGIGMGGGLGIGGGIVGLILALIFGGDIFGGGGGGPVPGPATTTEAAGGAVDETPAERERAQFVSFVLDDAQQVWARLLPQMGSQYREAKLVLFRDIVQSGCGMAQSASGPFYCPLDEKAYIDLGFFDELHQRFGASGDFAQAYVLAHEIGHHVQQILGTSNRVRELQQQRPNMANELSVRLELQADCYAGVWGASTNQRGILEQEDVGEGLRAAAAIGDDRIMKMSGRAVSPESFTHGTSEQRVAWFKRGLQSGDPRTCDSFSGSR